MSRRKLQSGTGEVTGPTEIAQLADPTTNEHALAVPSAYYPLFLTYLPDGTHSITADGIQILRATVLREPNSELWFSYNPDQDDHPVHTLFRLTERHPSDPPPPKQALVRMTSWPGPTFVSLGAK
jgi:hypothetical protein